MKRPPFAYLLMLLLGLSVFATQAEQAESTEPAAIDTEVLVFVDVSGSMKKNDPMNMRAPAIRMLAGMAPENARVGIYVFGTTVRELVAFERVQDRWKLSAESASRQYQSRDMYTNIEAALLQAQQTWQSSAEGSRSIILLTDGIVDIDKNSIVSDASRERILENVLPELQEYQTTVHTIALSENADHELLEALAQRTEGVYQRVDSAEMLQRTFMGLFEQAAPQDTVPLEGNGFVVDSSISELTLLVFRKADAEPTRIQTPSELLYSAETKMDGMRWKQDTGYDLISIEQPEPGRWQILADEDPDNRAMIVTDLKLKTNELPALMLQGEAVNFEAWLEEAEQIITKTDFLNLVKASLSIEHPDTDNLQVDIPAANEQGMIQYEFDGSWVPGSLDAVLRLDGETFVRERRFPITVLKSPIMVNWEQLPADELTQVEPKPSMSGNILDPEMNPPDFEAESGWRISVQVIEDLIQIENSQLTVEILSQDGQAQEVEINTTENGWSFDFVPYHPGRNALSVRLDSISPSGREFHIEEPLIELGQEYIPPPVEEITEESSLPSFNHILIPVVLGNLLFIILFVAWKFIQRMRAASYLHPEEAL